MSIKPPCKYFGGKSGVCKTLLEFFPESDKYTTFIEPFGGSYAMGLANDYSPPVEIYNDLEKNVYALYKVISDSEMFIEFKNKCDLVHYSEDLRKEFKEDLKNNDMNLTERAFKFFYVNRTSHNGVGGLSISTNAIRRNMSKSVSDFLSAIDRLPELHQRLSKLIVLNTDGIELIKKFDREQTFFYLDPPYHQSTRTAARYEVDMNNEQQEKFIDTVINVKKAKLLISGYDCPLYETLLSNGFTKHSFTVNTVDGKRNPKKKIEHLWMNY